MLRGNTNNSSNQVDSILPNKWVEHFFSLFNVKENDKNKLEGINKIASDNKHDAILDSPFTIEEISKGIRELKLRKASGNDSISNEMIIADAPTILPFLVSFLNEILKSHYYPENWCKGIITPIHKQGEIDNPDNYRGITINSCLSKLFNLLLTKRLTTFTSDNQILKYNQIGFRKSFRTSYHVFTIKTIISKYLKENKKLYLCFVDFRKAYNSIWREALFYKLSAYYDVSTNFINILDNMYKKVNLSVRLPNGITQSFSSNIALKQGCNLSPILFNIFINDLNEIFDKTFCQPAKIKNLTLNNLLYTDDLILVSETSSGLQNCLDRLQEYCDKWRLTVKIKKN